MYCIALSSAADINRKGRPFNEAEWKGIFGYDVTSAADLVGSKHDLFALAAQCAQQGREIPCLHIWCGTEDFLLEDNRAFHAHLTQLGLPHTYEESEGNHSWKWWDLHIEDGLRRVLQA